MIDGEFYASQGPRFSCRLEKVGNGFEFLVDCEPEDKVERVTIFTNRPWENERSVLRTPGDPVTEARFRLEKGTTFVRAEVYAGENTGWGQIFPIPQA